MRFFLLLAALGAPLLYAGAFAADPYPTKPIRLVVTFAPGGTADLVGRIVAQKMAELLGQQVIVENRGGAGGNIGAALAAQANPDGYTLLLGATSNMAINVSLYKKLPYRPLEDFVPIGLVASAPHLMVVNASLPVQSVQDFVAYAKRPGQRITFGSGGVGTPTHLAGVLFQDLTGIAMVHVPYKGSGPALTDLMGGVITVIFDSLPAALPLVQSKRLKAVAQTGAERVPELPDVPTMQQSGLKSLVVTGWFGLFVRAGAPKSVVDTLDDAARKTLASQQVRQDLAKRGAIPGDKFGPAFGAFVADEIKKWGGAVAKAGAVIE